jgi:peroxiredoxin
MRISTIALLIILSPALLAQETPEVSWGHSHLGKAYDEGPRQRPWRMEGIGDTPFPISTTSPEAQDWFNQGNALLHSFWDFEAERAFRWCLKLDPKCAMAYWGLARAAGPRSDRGAEFLAKASALKSTVTPRERSYIEILEIFRDLSKTKDASLRESLTERMSLVFDELIIKHPEDVEAKALYWVLQQKATGAAIDSVPMRSAMEALLQDVLKRAPNHVGAHHYRVHNWDGKQGRFAIESCMKLQEIATQSGHLQHMPGHVLSGIGLWHEAAIAMDSATRVEKSYMNRRMVFPADNWDYVHNLDYLSYIQSQLGQFSAARISAEQLLYAPRPTGSKAPAALYRLPLVRLLVKFEKWDEILEPQDPEVLAAMVPPLRAHMIYARGRAHIGKGQIDQARAAIKELSQIAEMLSNPPSGAQALPIPPSFIRKLSALTTASVGELEGLLKLAEGDALAGIEKLTAAAEAQAEHWMNDPPMNPSFAFNLLGEAYLDLGASQLAAQAFARSLETVAEDGFALAGLVRAHHRLGETEKARDYLARLEWVWMDAEPNPWLDAARATGLKVEPRPSSLLRERRYATEVLAVKGPSLYRAPTAPELRALDSAGHEISLENFAGKNVLIVFYLGETCLHCVEQLQGLNDRFDEFKKLDTVILAVSRDDPATIAAFEKEGGMKLRLLSDPKFENARRFHSYDDFEGIELHSTVLIGKDRGVHWAKTGGDPFMKFDYLLDELRRLEEGLIKKLRDQTARR